MNNKKLDELLKRAKEYLKKAESSSNQYSNIDYRSSASLIIDFYNILLLDEGKRLGLKIEENDNLDKKMFIISQELPEIFDNFKDLTDKVSKIRNKLAHTNKSIPPKNKLKDVINSAESFKTFVESKTQKKLTSSKKQQSLQEKYKDKTEFIKILLKHTYWGFEKASLESEEFNRVFKRLKILKRINITSLDNASIKGMIELAEETIEDAEKVYDYIQGHCPKCGAPLEIKTESKTFYCGPPDDPEPDYYEVYQIVKCSKCDHIIETELLDRESI